MATRQNASAAIQSVACSAASARSRTGSIVAEGSMAGADIGDIL